MTKHLASICIAVAAGLGPSTGQARPWPDASTQAVVFADQLPNSLTASQRQFAATRLAGTQKMLRHEIQELRAYNTNFLCLHYQLGVGAGPASFIIGDAWSSDWAHVTTQSNWFLLNTATQRAYQTTWDWYVMNVTYSNGQPNTAYPQYWITQVLARITSAEDDGVFADSYTLDAYSFGQCSPSHPWLESVGLCLANWVPALNAFGGAVRAAFDADPNGYLFLPNLGGLITSWDTTDYGVGHGGMIEGFCFWSSGNFFDSADWQLQMTRALALARSNKVVICQTYPDTLDYTGRLFAVASYLLVKGAHTYINLNTAGIELEYFPEYTVDLGGALSAPPASVTNYRHAWGVYRRDFTNGLVLVNPETSPVTIPNLGTNFFNVSATGGGTVNASGQYAGALAYASVTSLTVAAHGGAILIRAGKLDTDRDSLPDTWESNYFGSATGALAAADGDGDRVSNLNEYFAGTDPTNSLSFLGLSGASLTNGVRVAWPGVSGKLYGVGRCTNLLGATAFADLGVTLTGTASTTFFADTNAPAGEAYYRIFVK